MVLIWVLFADFMIMYYGLQFDRDTTYDRLPETVAAQAEGINACPENPRTDWLTEIELSTGNIY